MIALLFAVIPAKMTPLDALLDARGFKIAGKFQTGVRGLFADEALSETIHIDAVSGKHKAVLRSRNYVGSNSAQFWSILSSSAMISTETTLGLEDGLPAGHSVLVDHKSILEELNVRRAGDVVETALPEVLVGSGVTSTFFWTPIVTTDRTPTLGDAKSHLGEFRSSLLRWHQSISTSLWGYVDNIQRVAGREMVAKVDKNQNVYVDMNELSRHRGWNFSISLEPARADVRIGNDLIRIYPGADRIHINNELVTLPGTVPSQGYGVYLPLRLLQERGYLPSPG